MLALSLHLPYSWFCCSLPCYGPKGLRSKAGRTADRDTSRSSILSPSAHPADSVCKQHHAGSPCLYTVYIDRGRHNCCLLRPCSNETFSESSPRMPMWQCTYVPILQDQKWGKSYCKTFSFPVPSTLCSRMYLLPMSALPLTVRYN